ncbi:hypothetical protein HAX54_013888 [Datura stramonium]|uniref:Uncharacterized protein n=1 Tax=Datura stramonium TaxID=4076 RepID=A0ABS8TPS7_DATST|nr:hypothetical protein [Datura stramonium]
MRLIRRPHLVRRGHVLGRGYLPERIRITHCLHNGNARDAARVSTADTYRMNQLVRLASAMESGTPKQGDPKEKGKAKKKRLVDSEFSSNPEIEETLCKTKEDEER